MHRSGRTARAGKTGRVVTLATHKEQRAIGGITTRAGVEPWVMAIKPLDEKLISITGAKEPSGIPLTEEKETALLKKSTAVRPNRVEKSVVSSEMMSVVLRVLHLAESECAKLSVGPLKLDYEGQSISWFPVLAFGAVIFLK